MVAGATLAFLAPTTGSQIYAQNYSRFPTPSGRFYSPYAHGPYGSPSQGYGNAFEIHGPTLKAFEVNAIDYLLKPVHEDRFRGALERAKARIQAEPAEAAGGRMLSLLETIAHPRQYLKRLAIRSSAKTVFVKVQDVDWMEAAENYVQLHVGEKRHLLHIPITTLEASLDPNSFVRVHRSVIVNLQRIKSLSPATHGQYTIVLESGVQLQSGRSYSEAVRALTVNHF